jgi:hypothetical protein
MCTWVFQGKPVYVLMQKRVLPHKYMTVTKTTHVHPQKHGNVKDARANNPLNYHRIGCMSTRGRGNMRIFIYWLMRTLLPLLH